VQNCQLRYNPVGVVPPINPQGFTGVLMLEIWIPWVLLICPVIPPLKWISKEGLPQLFS